MIANPDESGQGSSVKLAIIIIAVSAVLFVGLIFGFRAFVFQPFSMPSESSVPNLMTDDYFFVSKFAYRFGDPQRGDIAVFKLPSDDHTDYVKRVVGLPGDRIQMTGGVLHINGQPVILEPVTLDDVFKTSPDMHFFCETLPNGRSYVIADIGEMQADNTEEYIVPAGRYFTLGDNRDNSQDSRFLDAVGYIPRENFVGPLAFLVMNLNGVPIDGRPSETCVEK